MLNSTRGLRVLDWTARTSRFVLFTGKGGVGKTTIAAATAIAGARAGHRVLVVGTDPASNLDDVFGARIGHVPTPVPSVAGLFAMNIDPETAAAAYREKVLEPLRGSAPEAELRRVEEQLSGQCTVEIAAFDEFSALVGEPDATAPFDQVIFDTAPTSHTLRLLELPAAWGDYIASSPEGASCLGPLAALETKRAMYRATVHALGDATTTTVMLVTRPEISALREAARAAGELTALGITNQHLVINGVLTEPAPGDPIAEAFAERQRAALASLPPELTHLPVVMVPLVAADLVGVDALERLVAGTATSALAGPGTSAPCLGVAGLDALVADLAAGGPGVVLVMGKGGVGKTSIATALARGLAQRECATHLSTTDPAGRLPTDEPATSLLTVSRIDPHVEVRRYVAEKLQAAERLEPARRALLEEDLRSPCTEELAVFQAFAALLRLGRRTHVVIDTAPSGHTLLLLDRTGAYHRDVVRTAGAEGGRFTTPLMRLQDPAQTKVLLVTLAETTPVHEAAALQDDLRRAGIEPYGWVINASLAATDTKDRVLAHRAALEVAQIRRVHDELAARCWLVPWSQASERSIGPSSH